MALEGINAHPDDVVVTVGSQMALDLTTRIFCDPGDVILAEAPSYVGALGTFAAYQAQVVHVAMDDDGLIPDALAAAIETCRAPAGGSSSSTRSRTSTTRPASRFSETAGRDCRDLSAAGIAILEDNPYGLLGFDDKIRRAIRADDPDNVIYLGSFSKTFAPGLRVGWVLAPHAVREKLVLANESATLNPPVFNQMLISRYLAKFDWLGQIKAYRQTYAERRDAMLGALERTCPTAPPGPSRRWVLRLGHPPGGLRRRGDACRARSPPGSPTFPEPPSTPTVSAPGSCGCRTASPPPERIVEGVRRLAAVLESELDVMRTFGTMPSAARAVRGPSSPSPDTA